MRHGTKDFGLNDSKHFLNLICSSGREADHSPPSSAEVKEWVELYLHSPNTPSWRGAQLGRAQGQLYLYLYLYIYIDFNMN
jgi:hypothetical protein